MILSSVGVHTIHIQSPIGYEHIPTSTLRAGLSKCQSGLSYGWNDRIRTPSAIEKTAFPRGVAEVPATGLCAAVHLPPLLVQVSTGMAAPRTVIVPVKQLQPELMLQVLCLASKSEGVA